MPNQFSTGHCSVWSHLLVFVLKINEKWLLFITVMGIKIQPQKTEFQKRGSELFWYG